MAADQQFPGRSGITFSAATVTNVCLVIHVASLYLKLVTCLPQMLTGRCSALAVVAVDYRVGQKSEPLRVSQQILPVKLAFVRDLIVLHEALDKELVI